MPPRPRSHDKPIKQRHEPRFTKNRSRGQSKIKRQMAKASRRRNQGAK